MAIRYVTRARRRSGLIEASLPPLAVAGTGAASSPSFTGPLAGNLQAFQATGAMTFTASGGGSGEHTGSWSDINLAEHEIYRIDFGAQDYPIWTPNNATHHTYFSSGSWDGGPRVRIKAPSIGQTACGLGNFVNLWRNGTFAIRKFNKAWTFRAGPSLFHYWFGADWKFVIVHSNPTLINSSDPGGGERPMMNFARYDGSNPRVCAWAVGAGTVKLFSNQIYFGEQAGTWMGAPVIGPMEWVHFEMEMISDQRAEAPNGRIRGILTRRSGAQYTITIPWNYDGAWSVDDYIHAVQLLGGYWNDEANPQDADTYYELGRYYRMAANRTGLLGPELGFVTG